MVDYFYIFLFLMAILIVAAIGEKKNIPLPQGEDNSHDFHVRVKPRAVIPSVNSNL